MLSEYTSRYKGLRVGFVGMGVSNMPVLKLFASAGAYCTVRDKKQLADGEFHDELVASGARLICGEDYLSEINEEMLFLSPAVRPDIPEIVAARENGTYVTCEMEEFFRLCPCKKIAVTGSDGKTTTTTIIANLLREAGYRVHLGGNIGINLFASLDDIAPDDFAVVELSSFQLMKMNISPEIAVITNVSPNHLDWHRDMDEYIQAKKRIYKFQGSDGILVLNSDDSHSEAFASEAKGSVRFIGKGSGDIFFDEAGIKHGEKLLVSDKSIRLVGVHNRYNYCQAYCAVTDFVSDDILARVASDFGGVEHRIEFVREVNGVKFYNSSIDSSPTRTKACLESFENRVIVISGGYDKHIPYDLMGELFNRKVKHAVLCGATSEKIASSLDKAGFSEYEYANTYEEAVGKAFAAAGKGDCVVLSPASASFDMFKNFAARGDEFKRLVNLL